MFEKRPYLKMAFSNPYNLSLLLGGVAMSVLTANPIPAMLALGAEALWLLHGPDSKSCAAFSGIRGSRRSVLRSRLRNARSG